MTEMPCEVCVNEEVPVQECPMCKYSMCGSCMSRYLLSTHLDAHCMRCRRAWDLAIMRKLFPRRFLDEDYKRHRETVLLERERSRFPATMDAIALDREVEQLQVNITLLSMRLKEMKTRLKGLLNPADRPAATRYAVGIPCPFEGCRGFLDQGSGRCGICDRLVCLGCNTAGHEGRDCHPEDRAQWEEIRRTTRPCPGCHTRIFKVSGCDQMWCPVCRTPFSWQSGEVVRGEIHNPHYFEWLFRQGGNHARPPPPCDGARPPFDRRRLGNGPDGFILLSFHRLLVHIRLVELPRLQGDPDMTLDLRKQYLRGDISEAAFTQRLRHRENRRLRQTEFGRVLEMLHEAGNDILQRALVSGDARREAVTNVTALLPYVNDCFRTIGRTYECMHPRIALDTMTFTRFTSE